ncbi:MAG: RluA family pseudouridine synthase [Verrucomicrobiales bacterium]
MDANIPSVIVRGSGWAVVGKPSGPATHSSPDGSDVISVLARAWPETNPVAVHRLDAATSGCLLIALEKPVLRFLTKAFATKRVRKSYLAVLHGRLETAEGEIFTHLAETPPDSGRMVVVEPGAGPIALTVYRVLASKDDCSLVEAEPITGRTHQLRVHFRHLGHPILGDALYGRPGPATEPRLLLHARQLVFPAPEGGEITAISPVPEEFGDWDFAALTP